jgi:hypothetical protein
MVGQPRLGSTITTLWKQDFGGQWASRTPHEFVENDVRDIGPFGVGYIIVPNHLEEESNFVIRK